MFFECVYGFRTCTPTYNKEDALYENTRQLKDSQNVISKIYRSEGSAKGGKWYINQGVSIRSEKLAQSDAQRACKAIHTKIRCRRTPLWRGIFRRPRWRIWTIHCRDGRSRCFVLLFTLLSVLSLFRRHLIPRCLAPNRGAAPRGFFPTQMLSPVIRLEYALFFLAIYLSFRFAHFLLD